LENPVAGIRSADIMTILVQSSSKLITFGATWSATVFVTGEINLPLLWSKYWHCITALIALAIVGPNAQLCIADTFVH